MGQTQSNNKDNFKQTLTFIQSRDDPHFGFVDIYRTKQAPYQYLMNCKKNFMEDTQRTTHYVKLIQQLKSLEHKNIAKIHSSQLIEETQVCIKHKRIHTFYNYYNFTLENAIQKKKLRDSFFPESQLLYIMGALIDAAFFLQQYGIAVGNFTTKNIFLSPEGYVKLYLLQIEQQNKHSAYYKALAQRSKIDQYILSPQQLAAIGQMQYQTKYDVYKADLFAIGMVILELITFDKTKYYLNQLKNQLKIDRIAFDLSSYGKNFTDNFVNLMKGCIHPDPASRLTLKQAQQVINQLKKYSKNITYCIRLQDDDEDCSRKNLARRQIGISVKGQHILNGLQKKLTPYPISTLSVAKGESKTISGRSSQTGSFKI